MPRFFPIEDSASRMKEHVDHTLGCDSISSKKSKSAGTYQLSSLSDFFASITFHTVLAFSELLVTSSIVLYSFTSRATIFSILNNSAMEHFDSQSSKNSEVIDIRSSSSFTLHAMYKQATDRHST
ncbi:hypothetical protein BpHYR1_050974 [Brachionus plicatilis]|uniref:Uncharacterized protein n=1 Tax=Brachionus plicatilis TaxID=10195 RepID=A0A3M7QXC4_BRAPC|nr:hypothetical protein BpHYR1_050974 [Brachionus plicatilis]